ncbi:MAG: phenylacetate--CoA ligase family protein [Akkermansiaceae bacterium]|nr:phenylacetate--CoA ligase family protein [Akkermansiaceae bacterium]
MTFEQQSNLRSNLPTAGFPALPAAYPSMLLSLQHQLDASQWWTPEQLLEKQFQQLRQVLTHARNKIPFHAARLKQAGIDPGKEITMDEWMRIPFMSRRDFQGKEKRFTANPPPTGHGQLTELKTSGSTAQPIKIYATRLVQFYWDALSMRDHYWHKRDFNRKLVSIRYISSDKAAYPKGMTTSSWGDPVNSIFRTGPAAGLDIKRTDVADQLEWLSRQEPEYFLTYPSNAAELAKLTISEGREFPSLKELRLMGEVTDEATREICGRAWKVPISDMYSANEVGYIALQCPEEGKLHIQSENVLVEVVDEDGKACAPGETGKVVVSTMQNFAMPMIRYELGDYAEVGAPCACGRGLPVLNRVLGRVRNMLALPTGKSYWPVSGWGKFAKIAPITQHQLVQKDLENIEVRLVAERPLETGEEDELRKVIAEHLGHEFHFTFVRVDRIERSAGGKFEEFLSEVPTSRPA